MASTTQDDGFHEIQLNGKQLVFLFMAVTVVSVVIFLSGVLVGRGVQLDRGGPVSGGVDPSVADAQLPPPPADSGNTPFTKEEGLEANGRLGANPPAETALKEGQEPSARSEEPLPDSPRPMSNTGPNAPNVNTAPDVKTAPAPAVAAADIEPTPAAPSAPAGKGLEIQLSAFRDRKGADVLANRLNSMGFAAYVVPPGSGAPALYRVRVGKFKERREAEVVADRLKKEKFTPWILP